MGRKIEVAAGHSRRVHWTRLAIGALRLYIYDERKTAGAFIWEDGRRFFNAERRRRVIWTVILAWDRCVDFVFFMMDVFFFPF